MNYNYEQFSAIYNRVLESQNNPTAYEQDNGAWELFYDIANDQKNDSFVYFKTDADLTECIEMRLEQIQAELE